MGICGRAGRVGGREREGAGGGLKVGGRSLKVEGRGLKLGEQEFEGGRANLGPPLRHRPERGQDVCKMRTHDAGRRVATVFEKLHCLIRTSLSAGRGKPRDKRLNP